MPERKDVPAVQAETSGGPTVYERIVGKFRKPKLSREHALQARPVRNPSLKWEALDNGEVQITLPRRSDAMGKVLSGLFSVPQSKPVNLDVVGARVWQLCDGEHTVNEIAEALMDEHRIHRREAEVSLTEFLKMLGKRNMVAFVVPTEHIEMPEKPAKRPPAPSKAGTPTKPGRSGRKRKR